jgi:hypothetical protein
VSYGVLHAGFWDGPTGRLIAKHGGPAGQLVAVYLMENKDANMIGLYQVRLPVIRDAIGTLTMRAVVKGLSALGTARFADYDLGTDYVWVLEMAKFRLGLDRKPLKKDDNRVTHAINLYDRAKPNPFLAPFFKRYREDLHLPKRRAFTGKWKPLERAFQGEGEGAPQSSSSTNYQDHLADPPTNKQAERAEDQKPRAENARPSPGLLKAIWHEVYDESEAGTIPYTDLSSLTEVAKTKCGGRGLEYSGPGFYDALENARKAVEHTRARRSA